MDRYREDFELWCRECVQVFDKQTGLPVPFMLNAPQRRVLGIMERQRRAGKPVRLIMLKARQWGGSTLVQMYMAWMQLVRRKGWNSLICCHLKDAAANIRGMYGLMLEQYPFALKEAGMQAAEDENRPKDWRERVEKAWRLTPFEKSQNISRLPARECRVTLASSLSPNSLRGSSYHMAHLSEVAFWGDGDQEVGEQIVRSVAGSILRLPETLIVMESTADGTDNYFHDEWERACRGESDKEPVFVPWHEIELYRTPVADPVKFAASAGDYERELLRHGVSAEAVAWYREKRKEYGSQEQMMAEFPSTPEEAFSAVKVPPLRCTDFL